MILVLGTKAMRAHRADSSASSLVFSAIISPLIAIKWLSLVLISLSIFSFAHRIVQMVAEKLPIQWRRQTCFLRIRKCRSWFILLVWVGGCVPNTKWGHLAINKNRQNFLYHIITCRIHSLFAPIMVQTFKRRRRRRRRLSCSTRTWHTGNRERIERWYLQYLCTRSCRGYK